MPRLHIVIPFYNEGPTLEPCVARVRAAPLPDGWRRSLVLVDDDSAAHSHAATDELVQRIEAEGECIRFFRHEFNRGKGAALRTGFDMALKSAADDDLVIIQDADLEYDPQDYTSLMTPLIEHRADAVYGTRWGSHFEGRGVWRRLHTFGNRALTFVSNALTGFRLSDMECCYKVFPIPVLRRVRPMMTEDRFGVEPQLTAILSRLKCRVVERPIRYDPREFEAGKKIGWRDAVRAIFVIVRERFRSATPASEAPR